MNRVSKKIISNAHEAAQKLHDEFVMEQNIINEKYDKEIEILNINYDKELEELYQSEFNKINSLNKLKIKMRILKEKNSLFDNIIKDTIEFIKRNGDVYKQFILKMIIQGVPSGASKVIYSKDDVIFNDDFKNFIKTEIEQKIGHDVNLSFNDNLDCGARGILLNNGRIEYNALVETVVLMTVEKYEEEILSMLF